VSDKEMMAERL